MKRKKNLGKKKKQNIKKDKKKTTKFLSNPNIGSDYYYYYYFYIIFNSQSLQISICINNCPLINHFERLRSICESVFFDHHNNDVLNTCADVKQKQFGSG